MIEQIKKRRTFAIISHPDAGKTTLTEKFLLYGGAINLAGTVKGRKAAKHAVSDWMDIEKERGISVTSSAMQFNYDGFCINILDTPGHQDFSEDTYRTLMAADSAVMVIDGSKGVEAQTIKLFKVFSNEEKERLFSLILKGDMDAREEYIKGNLRLVLSVIQRFAGSQENIDDLFQIGCIGLIKAIDNFDITQNVKFSTYAVPMILGEVRRYLRDNNSIRVSRSLRDTAYKALYAREQLTRLHSKEPSLMEISQEIGISGEDITYALDAIQTPVSLYEPVYTDGGDPLYVMDQISDKKNLEENWVEDLSLSEAMKRLPNRERRIIDMRFFEGKTQTEVAKEIHISQAQVSRLEKSALKSMRSYLNS